MSFIRKPPTIIISEETQQRQIKAKENNNFGEAIAIAKDFAMARYSSFCENKAIGWLYEALSFKPNDVAIEEAINLDEFFSLFNRLHCSYLFHDDARPLLGALIRNKTISELDLSSEPDDGFSGSFNFANKNLSDFIGGTKSLKKLNISLGDTPYQLQTKDMHSIANGLQLNTSIVTLNIQQQPIGDEGLNVLLNALASNPRCRLRELNILDIGITDTGANALLAFLQNNITLTSLDLVHEEPWCIQNMNNISSKLLIAIDSQIKLNRNEVALAHTRGAMFGLFNQIGLPGELGWNMGQFFSQVDGKNVALVSKVTQNCAIDAARKLKLSRVKI